MADHVASCRPARLSWAAIGLPGALLLFWLVFWFTAPGFATTDNQWNISRQVSVLALAAMGQTFAVVSGGLDISVGAVVGFSSVVAALAAGRLGTLSGMAAGVLAAIGIGTASGGVAAFCAVDPIIVTIGMLSVARGAAFYITRGIPVTAVPAGYARLGSGSLGPVPLPAVFTALAFLGMHVLMTRAPLGRNLYAVGGNEEAARLAGLNVRLYRVVAYAASAGLAGCAGIILSSRANSGQATLGYGLELESIAAVVIGGTRLFAGDGSMPRSLLGALLIAVLGNGMDLADISPYIRQVMLGAIVIGAVVFSNLKK